MREKIISVVLLFIISFLVYINIDSSNHSNDFIQLSKANKEGFLSDENLLKSFDSGISIRDLGEMVIIEQKPNKAIIIHKNNLDEIIAFLSNTNSVQE